MEKGILEMRRMIQRVSVLFIAFTMIMVCFPLKVQAQVESEALLFINEELYIGSAENAYNFDKNGMEKYTRQTDKWEIVGNTLTLNGFSFETTSGLGLVVADGGIIELAAGSVNTIKTSGSFNIKDSSYYIEIYGKSLSIQGKGTLNTYGSTDRISEHGSSILSLGSLTLKDCTLNMTCLNVKYSQWVISNEDLNCDNVEINIYTKQTLGLEGAYGITSYGEDNNIKDSFINIISYSNLNGPFAAVQSDRGRITIEQSILNIENLGTSEFTSYRSFGVFSKDLMKINNSYVSVNKVEEAFISEADIIAENATVTGAKEEFLSGTSKLLTPGGENPVILDNKTFNFIGLTANGTTEIETTTELQLTFDSYVPSLTEDNITVTGAKKGALTKVSNRGEYTLAVSDITVEDRKSITVDIEVPNLKFGEKKQSVAEKAPDPVPVNYEMLEGANAQWSNGTKEGMVLKSNGELDKFKELKINGNIVGKENYLAQKGSTIITLKPEYLNTLNYGKYSVEMVFIDGSATTSITIKGAANGDDTGEEVKPGDDTEEDVTPGGKDENIKPGDGKEEDVTPEGDKGNEEKLPPVSQKPETKSPNTGDHTNSSRWILLMVMAGSIIMLSRFAKERSRD